ncbi:MetQ/NlpA family ABC transporter substrate-binding protein [Helicobacter fennelliae]|uniref:Methionine ABC transporter substrate-binding protein n=1 Tax=Helicobacter fennelliae MRY12-0050 TaxID=1325130 RepID=T1CS14_9HELI|nr:MetQ/NlpA family ABC transporter substrate-binding protein [Helicobacter fennelliae]GAD19569.1 methionine ABC transporter substrate-binding protein [Helicobacter fennelliae MRY12-0050]STP07870.1 ABC transporter substrate-binding protein [Helicobacter fennelliae]
MKKILSLILFLFGFFANAQELKIGATPIPHAQILKSIIPTLQKEGIELKIVEFTDYVTPNLALANKDIDANFMQHKPFLDKINKDRKLNLISIAQIHIEPIGGYSTKIKSINALPNGATIAIPSDATNGGRALILLHNNGLITLKNPNNLNATEFDIIQNPKNLKIKPIEAALLTKTLQDVDLAIINGNYAMQIRLKTKDALILEDSRSPYVNILAVRLGDENKAEIIKLKNALQSQEVKQFIQDTYKGEVIPGF